LIQANAVRADPRTSSLRYPAWGCARCIL
jgi:hypothetical protein